MSADGIPVPHGPFHGKFVSLVQVTYSDLDDYWEAMNLPSGADDTYRYLLGDPPTSKDDLWDRLRPSLNRVSFALKADPELLHEPPSSEVTDSIISRRVMLGSISFYGYDASTSTLDIGAIFAPVLQRTAASTEGIYLLLRAAFEPYDGPRAPDARSPPFHRIMWKCNVENTASAASARRYGFTYEGTLRKARVSKGRWISSAWSSMLDEDWPMVRAGFDAWLREGNFDENGRQRKRLEECRAEASQRLRLGVIHEKPT